jgi:hypothetical protein
MCHCWRSALIVVDGEGWGELLVCEYGRSDGVLFP